MRDIAAQLLADSNVKVIQGKSDILRIVFRIEMYSNKSRAYFELIVIFAFRLIKDLYESYGRHICPCLVHGRSSVDRKAD